VDIENSKRITIGLVATGIAMAGRRSKKRDLKMIFEKYQKKEVATIVYYEKLWKN